MFRMHSIIGKAVTILIIAVTFLIFGEDAGAVNYSMSITTSGSKVVNVSPRSNGVGTSIVADNINVQTNCRAGYNLAMSASVNNTRLFRDGNISNNAAGTFFTPSNGSTALENSPNTWGYLMSDTPPTGASVFNAVRGKHTAPSVLKTPVASTTDINDSFDVYYGVSVSNNMSTGTYKMIPETGVTPVKNGAIVYYLTLADACTHYTVHFNPTGVDNNGVVRSGTGSMADQSIPEGTPTSLTANQFTPPTGYYFAGWNTAQNGTGTTYTDGQQVTDLVGAGEAITLYAMWTSCPGGKVCYWPNANDVTDTMADQTVGTGATNLALWPSNFRRTYYGFAGWNTKADGSGTKYGPMETVSITAGQYNVFGLNLYAMWVEPARTNNVTLAFQTPNLFSMVISDGTGQTLADKPIGYVTALRDTRDGQFYAIAKLADGKYWMIENLRIDDAPELTSTNTNNPGIPMLSTWFYANSQGTPDLINHLSATSDPTQTATAWCTEDSWDCDNQSMLATNNTTMAGTTINSMTNAFYNVYSYGNYYNWHSATAGRSGYAESSGNSTGDLCPNGWRLPTGGSATADFGALDVVMGGTGGSQDSVAASLRWRKYPVNLVFSGDVRGGSITGRDTRGNYWSSTAANLPSAFTMAVYSTGLDPGIASSKKHMGAMVRCVAP